MSLIHRLHVLADEATQRLTRVLLTAGVCRSFSTHVAPGGAGKQCHMISLDVTRGVLDLVFISVSHQTHWATRNSVPWVTFSRAGINHYSSIFIISHHRCNTKRLQMRDQPTAAEDRSYRCHSSLTAPGSNTPTSRSRSDANVCCTVSRRSRDNHSANGKVKVRFRRANRSR